MGVLLCFIISILINDLNLYNILKINSHTDGESSFQNSCPLELYHISMSYCFLKQFSVGVIHVHSLFYQYTSVKGKDTRSLSPVQHLPGKNDFSFLLSRTHYYLQQPCLKQERGVDQFKAICCTLREKILYPLDDGSAEQWSHFYKENNLLHYTVLCLTVPSF